MSALKQIAASLREDPVIAPFVCDPRSPGALGELSAVGPRAAADAAEYAVVVESVREGYLLHYGEPRLIAGADDDLRLLAGDYLYALGLDRLAALGDLDAVRELADLISLCAQAHADGDPQLADLLWLASVVAIGAGGGDEHERAKVELRLGSAAAAEALLRAAVENADRAGIRAALDAAGESIGFALPTSSSSG